MSNPNIDSVFILRKNTTGNEWINPPSTYYWWVCWAKEKPLARSNNTPLMVEDVWYDLTAGTVKLYNGTDFTPAGVIGNSNGGFVTENVEFRIVDQNTNPLSQTGIFSFYGGDVPTRIYQMEVEGGKFNIRKANGEIVMNLDVDGNATFAKNVTVVGDLFADDVGYDEALINILRINTDIEHAGNPTNKISFATDKLTLDASGTSIVLDDTAMTDKIVVTGQTKFVNNIDDVPDIYLQNHIHHSGDPNTRIGFPANDQIELRTSGSNRVLVTDTVTTIGPTLQVQNIGGAPRLVANMSGAPESARFTIQNSVVDGNSRFYVTPNGTGTIAAIQMSNNSDLDAANQQRVDIGMVGGEFRCSANSIGTDTQPPFSWRTNAGEVMREFTNGTGTYPTDYDVLGLGLGVNLDGGAGIAQQGLMLKPRGQIQWSSAPADGGPPCTIFRATNSAHLVFSQGWRNSNTSGSAWESSASATLRRTAIELGGGAITMYSNPSQTGTAGSATGVTPQAIMAVNQTSTVLSQNSATTVIYQQTLSGLSPSNPIVMDVDIGRSNSNYAANIDSASYIANASWWNNSVARGFNLNGTLFAASLTNLSQSGLVVTITGVSASVLRFTFTDTSGVGSTKVGTVRITVTSSN
jgi:hypothetical protein